MRRLNEIMDVKILQFLNYKLIYRSKGLLFTLNYKFCITLYKFNSIYDFDFIKASFLKYVSTVFNRQLVIFQRYFVQMLLYIVYTTLTAS